MAERPFQIFIDLVSFDQAIGALEITIAESEQNTIQLKVQQEDFEKELQATKDNVVELRKAVDVCELEMKSLDEQEKEKKVMLEGISNYKEYQSVKTEIENIQQAQLAQEQIVMGVWNKLETAQRLVDQKQKECSEKIQKLQVTMEQEQQKLLSLRADFEKRTQERPEKKQQVPAEWLEKYNVMRARVSDPVVPIFQNSCSVCFYIVTGQEVIRAKRGALVQCKGCYRLLYVPEVMEESAK